jgi:hypothetical protein
MKTECPRRTRKWHGKAEIRRNLARWNLLIILLAGLWLAASSRVVTAAPISREKAGKAVETWVRHVTADARADAVVERIEPYQENGVAMAYVVRLANGGFCLAGADSLVLPVYFYSPKGVYDPKDPSCREILKEIAQLQSFLQTEAASNGAVLQVNKSELARRASFWEDLAAGKGSANGTAQPLSSPVPQGGASPQGAPITSGPVQMVLPLTCQWNQGPPFDDFCPKFPPDATPEASDLTDVGCVALATAQVMYYWKWPNSGVGRGSTLYNYGYTPTPLTTPLANDPGIGADVGPYFSWYNGVLRLNYGLDHGSMLSYAQNVSSAPAYQEALGILTAQLTQYQQTWSADFTKQIDWSAMRDLYPDADPTPVDHSEDQVAALCYELAVALKMDFGLWGSSAWDTNIPGVLSNNFGYDPSAIDLSPFSGQDPTQLVAEIQWLRPCILSGYNSAEGHTWVIYGYNMGTSPWQFEMNYGWQTSVNGWYSFDTIHEGLNKRMSCVTGVAPYKVVGFVGADSSGNGSPNSPYQNIEQAIATAPDNATLIFQANSVNTFSASSLVINRPLTLKGYNVTITK